MRIPLNAKVLDVHDGPILIYTAANLSRSLRGRIESKGVEVVDLPDENGRVDLAKLPVDLYERGICSVLVEGGSQILTSFFHQGNWDRYYSFTAPVLIGNQGIPVFGTCDRPPLENLVRDQAKMIDKDILVEYLRKDGLIDVYRNIEEKGIVKSITLRGESGFLEIQCQKVLEDTKLGDSIAVNGACLTVTSLEQDAFTADVMAETLRRTSLKELKKGSFVNLERALQIGHRLGGHMVSGHVDGIGIIRKLEPQGIAMVMTISTKSSITEGIIEKGSVAIDGISLTVVSVEEEAFSVSLIPHTIQETNLAHKKPGSTVNLETDMIGKYVKKFLTSETRDSDSSITMDLLAENGFLL